MAFFDSGSYISSNTYQETHRKRLKIILALVIVSLTFIVLFAIKTVIGRVKANNYKKETYNTAVKDYNEGMDKCDINLMDQAYTEFSKVSKYKDSKDYIARIPDEKEKLEKYVHAVELIDSEDFANAISEFHALGDFKDSGKYLSLIYESLIEVAEIKLDEKEYDEARKALLIIPDYAGEKYDEAKKMLATVEEKKKEDVKEKNYQAAVDKYNSGDYAGAQSAFTKIRDYKDSEDYIDKIGDHYYSEAMNAYENKDYDGFIEAIRYIDSESEWKRYDEANSLKQTMESEYKEYVTTTAMQIMDEEGYAAFESFVNKSVNTDFYPRSEADTL